MVSFLLLAEKYSVVNKIFISKIIDLHGLMINVPCSVCVRGSCGDRSPRPGAPRVSRDKKNLVGMYYLCTHSLILHVAVILSVKP